MTVRKATETADTPLSSQWLNLARCYLGNRWVFLALGAFVLLAGIGLNWGWLVAAGIAPILISVLPCLVMCGLGACMMCRSGATQTTSPRDAVDAATSPTALGVARMERPSAVGSSCCQSGSGQTQSPQVNQTHSINERRDSHA